MPISPEILEAIKLVKRVTFGVMPIIDSETANNIRKPNIFWYWVADRLPINRAPNSTPKAPPINECFVSEKLILCLNLNDKMRVLNSASKIIGPGTNEGATIKTKGALNRGSRDFPL